jgi:hypothetical protein
MSLTRFAFPPVGLHRSPPSFAVTSPLGRSYLLPFGPSCSASSPTSHETSSWEQPLWQEPRRVHRQAHRERRQVHIPCYEGLYYAPLLLLSWLNPFGFNSPFLGFGEYISVERHPLKILPQLREVCPLVTFPVVSSTFPPTRHPCGLAVSFSGSVS